MPNQPASSRIFLDSYGLFLFLKKPFTTKTITTCFYFDCFFLICCFERMAKSSPLLPLPLSVCHFLCAVSHHTRCCALPGMEAGPVEEHKSAGVAPLTECSEEQKPRRPKKDLRLKTITKPACCCVLQMGSFCMCLCCWIFGVSPLVGCFPHFVMSKLSVLHNVRKHFWHSLDEHILGLNE